MKKDPILEELVIKEATNLKKHATKQELAKLDYYRLSGDSITNCIYGQMTGNCGSSRSYRLIKKCCIKVYNVNKGYSNILIDNTLNGKPENLKRPSDRLLYYVSPIEKFLYFYKKDSDTNSTKIKKLVAFLKDETKELKF